MPLLKSIFGKSGADEVKMSLYVAYYLCDSSLNNTILTSGIPLCPDGYVHLFGNLSCALLKRDLLEDSGLKITIWKVDVTECGLALIDKAEEEFSQKTPCEHRDFTHGFVFKKAIGPQAIIEIFDLI